MNLNITLDHGRHVYAPGAKLTGTVSWQLEKSPKSVDLRLFWYTQGKGDEDLEVVREISFEYPSARQNHAFDFELPQAPYSFSGKLISLVWALELVAGKESTRTRIILSPYGQELDLTRNQ